MEGREEKTEEMGRKEEGGLGRKEKGELQGGGTAQRTKISTFLEHAHCCFYMNP